MSMAYLTCARNAQRHTGAKGRCQPFLDAVVGHSRIKGFTLIEILISLSLMAFLLTTATAAFTQVKRMTDRTRARQVLHNTARIVYEQFRFEWDCLQQSSACYLRSQGPGGGQEIVFLRAKLDNVDFTPDENYGDDVRFNSDLVWSRWAWDPNTQALSVGRSSSSRRFQLLADWTPGGMNYRGQWFAFLPEARRLAGTNPTTRLNDNAFGTSSAHDYGDYEDLLRRSSPIALGCSDFQAELVLQDGTTIAIDPVTTVTHALDGVTVDGTIGGAKRPRLLRLRFNLGDPTIHLTETFCFSFLAPGFLPD